MLSPLVICLALNIYWEARSEDAKHGIYALAAPALVVLNRVKHKDYPNHVCDVVKQSDTYHNGFPKKNKCQFSWYCDGKSDKPKDMVAWKWSQRIAELVITGGIEDVTEGATHYHAYYVKPKWVKQKVFIKQIGSHLYYKGKKNGK